MYECDTRIHITSSACDVVSIIVILVCASRSSVWGYEQDSDDKKQFKKFSKHSKKFIKLVESKEFIDKSITLEEMFQLPAKVFMTSPHGFGKSVTMGMMKMFFEMQVDENGVPIADYKNMLNYQFFKEHNLEITLYEKFCKTYLGRFPTIFIDYKPLLKVSKYEGALILLKLVLRSTFREHTYLTNNEKLWNDNKKKNKHDKYLFYRYCNKSETLTELEIKGGFLFLSKLLHEHFQRRVLILIDNYDGYLGNLMFSKNSTTTIKIYDLMEDINSNLLKYNIHLERCYLMGVIHESIEINSMFTYYFLRVKETSKFYGLDSNDLNILLKRLIEDNEIRMKTKNVIDYYHKGEYITLPDSTPIYNIETIIKFIKINMKYILTYTEITYDDYYQLLRHIDKHDMDIDDDDYIDSDDFSSTEENMIKTEDKTFFHYHNFSMVKPEYYIPISKSNFKQLFYIKSFAKDIQELLLGKFVKIDVSHGFSYIDILVMNEFIIKYSTDMNNEINKKKLGELTHLYHHNTEEIIRLFNLLFYNLGYLKPIFPKSTKHLKDKIKHRNDAIYGKIALKIQNGETSMELAKFLFDYYVFKYKLQTEHIDIFYDVINSLRIYTIDTKMIENLCVALNDIFERSEYRRFNDVRELESVLFTILASRFPSTQCQANKKHYTANHDVDILTINDNHMAILIEATIRNSETEALMDKKKILKLSSHRRRWIGRQSHRLIVSKPYYRKLEFKKLGLRGRLLIGICYDKIDREDGNIITMSYVYTNDFGPAGNKYLRKYPFFMLNPKSNTTNTTDTNNINETLLK